MKEHAAGAGRRGKGWVGDRQKWQHVFTHVLVSDANNGSQDGASSCIAAHSQCTVHEMTWTAVAGDESHSQDGASQFLSLEKGS